MPKFMEKYLPFTFIYPFIGNIRENDHVKYRKGDKNSEKTETE